MKVKETAVKYQGNKKPFTYRDYLNLPDDGKRYEVINGELVMTPSPITVHQRVSRKIGLMINKFVEDKNLGEIFFAPFDVVLSETDVFQPDIIFISNERKQIITEENISGAPDLVVEILSPSTADRDLFDKKEIYQKFGVKEYWIVDPKQQWIDVYNLQQGKFKLSQHLEKTGTLKSNVFKDFKFEIEEIFKR